MASPSSTQSALRWLAALFAAFALVPLSVALYSVGRGLESADWPHVSGTILESTWKVQSGANSFKIPIVRYRYEVEGASFEGERVQFGPVVFVEERVGSLPAGSVQKVYYDRADPGRSTLSSGIAWPTVGLYGAACAFSLLVAAYCRREAARHEEGRAP